MSSHWYCPLFQNEISAGRCLDINYERVGLLNANMFDEVNQATGKTKPEIICTCLSCPNQPVESERKAAEWPGVGTKPDEVRSAQ